MALFNGTTAEIERSEEPCAIATMLILACASAEKKRSDRVSSRQVPQQILHLMRQVLFQLILQVRRN